MVQNVTTSQRFRVKLFSTVNHLKCTQTRKKAVENLYIIIHDNSEDGDNVDNNASLRRDLQV